ncbi:histidine kinase [Myxococcus sp. K15C18031901]|uniref:sensor histidine kinase n=1 Tax=Myxococcus dinghuensis TaxID=2906761 RepID=UPI0020A6DB6F|nr:histidine kinase [Myxococcus dinghuensis]MCP3099020.1 histidine kinase [Myxococcus dinghuensis]
MTSRHTWVYAACQWGGWSFYALTNLLLFLVNPGMSGGAPLLAVAVWACFASLCGLLVTHGARAWLKPREWVRLPPRALGAHILGASLGLGALQTLLAFLPPYLLAPTRPPIRLLGFVYPFIIWALVMLIWLLIYCTVHSLRHTRTVELERWKLEAAAQSAELRFLKAQLQPHFLFNCLNSTRALITEDPLRAQEVVTRLSSLLRYALASRGPETVPLEHELQVVRDYLSLEGVRLDERLRVREDVAPDTLGVPVPAMLVQTLVENAIKHGIARMPEGGEVSLSAQVREGILCLEVANTAAPTSTPPAPHSGGVGLHNASERLRLLCGANASLQLDQTQAATTTARVRIPLPP